MNDRGVEGEAAADGHEVHEGGGDVLVAQRAADLEEQVRDRVLGQLAHTQHAQHGLFVYTQDNHTARQQESTTTKL